MKAGPAFVLIAALSLLQFPPPAAGAPPDSLPEVFGLSIVLDNPDQEARVTDSAPGIVQFTGQMTVDKPPVQRAVVTLESSVDTGWVSSISPSSAVFTSTTPQSFTVTVVVPEKTLSTLTGRLLVRGTMTCSGQTSEATANGTIAVVQYFLLSMTCDAPYFETGKSGVSTTYKVLINNKGNGPDTFAIEVSNLKDLVSGRWTVALDKEVTPIVQPGLYGEVLATVTSPKEAPVFEGKRMPVILKASSVGAGAQYQNISVSYPVYFFQKAIDPVFDVTVPIIIAAVVVASVAVVIWRWRRRRKGRIVDVEEVPPA